MELNMHTLSPAYTPVEWEYREVILEQINNGVSGKIVYFCTSEGICEAGGTIASLLDKGAEGLFVQLDSEHEIRVDRVITLFGKPGAAYADYEAYGNACLDCNGGLF